MLSITDLQTDDIAIDGHRIRFIHRGTDGDKGAIWQVFVQKQYQIPHHFASRIADAYDVIRNGGGIPLIIDAGANIGTSAVWFATQYPEAHLVALEPDPNNFRLLVLNTADLDIDPRPVGIDGQDGFGVLSDPGQGEMAYRICNSPAAGLRVPVVTIATLLGEQANRQYVPFLLKIDIEGSEKRVFAGDTAAIAQFPVIIIEPHDWMFPRQGVSSTFFAFHAREQRDFCFSYENVFSIGTRRDAEGPIVPSSEGPPGRSRTDIASK